MYFLTYRYTTVRYKNMFISTFRIKYWYQKTIRKCIDNNNSFKNSNIKVKELITCFETETLSQQAIMETKEHYKTHIKSASLPA